MSDISAIKLPDNSSHNIKAKKLFYAECSTAVNVVAKVISCDGFVLEPGAVIAIRFTSTTTTAPTSGNITLNINGTGAKNIVSKENNVVFKYTWAWYFSNNRTWLFVYNGTYFICLNQDNNNVNPEAFGIGYATCSTAETTPAKVAVFSGYVLRKNGIIAVKFTYAVPANSTLNINSKGAKNIFYRGAKITAGIINAGDIATFVYDGTQYQLISVDANYARKTDLPTIDTALSATSTNPVQNKVINSALAGKAAASHSHTISQISDFPASLPANGGNADTLDGFHASSLFCQRVTPSSKDCNDCTEVGAYFFNGCLANAPTSNGVLNSGTYFILESVMNNAAVIQTATFTHGTYLGRKFSRHLDMTSNSWSAWDEIMKNQYATGLISGLSNGSAVTVSLKFAPVAVLFFDSTYIKPVSSGFSISLGTGTFTITPSSVSAMGTTGVRYLAFGG